MAVVLNDVSYGSFSNISLEIVSGKITGILGDIESGKSVLVDLISNTLTPIYGNVTVEDSVGVVFQDVEEQFYFDTLIDNFNFILKMKNCKNIQKRILDSLRIVGLDASYLSRTYYSLSLSEVKKASLACALCTNPRILILDDIFNGLDKKDTDMVIRIIFMMKMRYGRTVIVVSRNSDLIHKICDKVIVVSCGNILEYDDKYNFFMNSNLLKKVGVRMPNIIKCTDLIKAKGVKGIMYRDEVDDLAKDIFRWIR